MRVPLLLNSVLCELRMNPEEQTRRLLTAEQRVAEVLEAEPGNLKALFRQAQLHGRAGEYTEAKALLEKLCRQQPSERAFRMELASLNTRTQVAKQETAAFWTAAVKKTLAEVDLDGMEGGGKASEGQGHASDDQQGAHQLLARTALHMQTAISALLQWMLLMWSALCQHVPRRRENMEEGEVHGLHQNYDRDL